MTIATCQAGAGYFATEDAPNRGDVPIREFREDKDPSTDAFLKACRRAGQACIEHHAASGTFSYVYFDRSETPTPALMRQLASLAWEFDLIHRHVLNGYIPAECYGDRGSLPFQGHFWGFRGEWTPERIEAFVERLAGVLPRFDRPAAITALVQQAIKDGYFVDDGIYPHCDDELERDVDDAYESWCREHDRPYILVHIQDYCIYCDCHGKVVTPDATTRIANLARRFNLEASANQSYTFEFGELSGGDRSAIPVSNFVGFAGPLHKILNDPRSYEPQPR